MKFNPEVITEFDPELIAELRASAAAEDAEEDRINKMMREYHNLPETKKMWAEVDAEMAANGDDENPENS
ncbi:MAG: hypothetical protein WCK93_12140 [Nitrosomonadales bacterium]